MEKPIRFYTVLRGDKTKGLSWEMGGFKANLEIKRIMHALQVNKSICHDSKDKCWLVREFNLLLTMGR